MTARKITIDEMQEAARLGYLHDGGECHITLPQLCAATNVLALTHRDARTRPFCRPAGVCGRNHPCLSRAAKLPQGLLAGERVWRLFTPAYRV